MDMKRRWRSFFITAAFGLFGLACAVATADTANPPDMTRFVHVSPEVVDKRGKLLRAFLTSDGYWRMKTTVGAVSPRYLKMLEAYENKHNTKHNNNEALAILRATAQFLSAGHVVSGGSTLTMQVARILELSIFRGIARYLFLILRAVER